MKEMCSKMKNVKDCFRKNNIVLPAIIDENIEVYLRYVQNTACKRRQINRCQVKWSSNSNAENLDETTL